MKTFQKFSVLHVLFVLSLATVSGAVAAECVHVLLKSGVEPGVRILGAEGLPNADILDAVLANGISLHRYVGN